MKICTACSASYSDENIIFCPVDGTTLTPQKEVSLDQVPFAYEMSDWSDKTEPASDEASRSKYFEPPVAAFSRPQPPPVSTHYSSAFGNNPRYPKIFLIVAGLLVLAGFVAALLMIASIRSNQSQARARSDTTTLANGARVRAEPVGSPISSGSGNATVYTNTGNVAVNKSVSVKSISRQTDFTGIWTGKFNEVSATLSITSQNGDTFSGTLSKNGYVIKLIGKIDFEKASVEITETDVLQTPANKTWSLGVDNGTIFDDGKSMSGIGKDKNVSYSWSFTRK